MSPQCLMFQSIMFITLTCVLVHKCSAKSLFTDGHRDKKYQTSVSKALKQMNVDVLRQLVNQESLLRLSLSKTVQAILHDVSNLKEKQEKTEKEVKRLKEDNEHLKGQVSMYKKQVSDLNSTILQKQLEDLRLNISRFINDETMKVGFTAGAKSNDENWSGTRLIFPRVTYAVGGGYNNNTGIFTSPIQGDFVFFLSVVSFENQYLYLDIKLNGVSKVRAMAYDGNFAEASNLVYLHLQKGDRVWVEWYTGRGYATFDDITLMSFSGFKI